MTGLRVIYFTCVSVGTTMNGGALGCREHVTRIAATPGVKLTLCTTGPPEQASGDAAFAASIGARAVFLAWQDRPVPPHSRWPFLWEAIAAAQSHVDISFAELLAAEAPDLLVVEYLMSALFIRRAYRAPVRRIMITQNWEARFFRDLRQLGLMPSDASATRIAEARLTIFEQWVYLRSHAVVTLTPGDLPLRRPGLLRAVLPPIFPPRQRRWASSGKGRLLFVGSVGHYPNHLAVEWIATRLAPQLLRMGSLVRLRILGAEANTVPPAWLGPNLDYLGTGDAEVAEQEFCTTDLFLAPIANGFGSKIKLLECLAYGTPFIATEAALSGISFIQDVPRIELERPTETAALILAALDDPKGLRQFSERASAAMAEQLVGRQDAWQRLLLETARP